MNIQDEPIEDKADVMGIGNDSPTSAEITQPKEVIIAKAIRIIRKIVFGGIAAQIR